MTVPSTTRRAGPFTGTGALVAYPFTFKVFAKQDLAVTIADANGLETDLVLDSTFTVTLNVDQEATPGGTVNYAVGGVATALPLGYTLVVTGDGLEFEQTADLPQGGNFSPVVIENALDRIVMLLQRLWDGVRRSMRLPDTASDSVSTVLPVPTANNFIGWDSNGTALRNVDPNTLATVVAFAAWQSQAFSGDGVTTQFTLSSDPGNVNNLDVVVGTVPQRNNVDFTLSGTTLTFDVAPANGLSIFCRWGQALPEGTSTLQTRLLDTASAADGDALIGQLRTFAGAVATTNHAALEKQPIHVAADVGVSTASSQAATRTAVQAAIAAAGSAGNTAGGSTVFVSPYLSYGYKAADSSTWPSFAGISQPVLLQDCSADATYAGYPTGYSGMQLRFTSHTPQTTATLTFTAGLASGATSGTLTSNFTGVTGPYTVTFSNSDVRAVTLTNGATTATWSGGLSGAATSIATRVNEGQHDGNTFNWRASWAPYIVLDNTGDYAAAGAASRRALDNRRAAFATANDGVATWQIGQQGEIGANKTDEEMSNWALQKFSVAGDTLGAYTPYQVNRKTARISYGGGRTNPNGVHHFESSFSDTGVPMILIENSFATDCKLTLRNSAGSGQDVSVVNNAGALELSSASGVGFKVNASGGTSEVPFPVKHAGYVRAALPNAATLTGHVIRVNDAIGGITDAISDGTNWISYRTNAAV